MLTTPPPIIRPDPYPGTHRKVVMVGHGYICFVIVKKGKISKFMICDILPLPEDTRTVL